MGATKRVMAAGFWDVELHPNTPIEVTDLFDLEDQGFGHLHVLPTRVDVNTLTNTQLAALAIFTGVYRRQANRLRLEGAHGTVWLGDENGKGPLIDSTISHTNGTFEDWIADLVPFNVTDDDIETVASPTLTWDVGLAVDVSYASRRAALDYVVDYFAREWEFTDNWRLNAGTADHLYGDATILLTPELVGTDIERTVLRATFDVERNLDNFANDLRGRDADDNPLSVSIAPTYNTHLGSEMLMREFVDISTLENTPAVEYLDALVQQRRAPERRIDVTLHHYAAMAAVRNGCKVLAWDPRNGIYDLDADPIYHRGQPIWPLTLRVLSVYQPNGSGLGFYIRRSTDQVVVDISDWVVRDNGPARLEVGAPQPPPAAFVGAREVRTAA